MVGYLTVYLMGHLVFAAAVPYVKPWPAVVPDFCAEVMAAE